MNKFFDSENVIWRFFGSFADLMGLTLCWVLCSLPLLTISGATTALYDSVARCVKGEEGGAYRRFFRTFRNELGRGVGMTLMWLVIATVLGFSYFVLCVKMPGSVVALTYLLSLLIPLAIYLWALLINSRFVYGFLELHKAAVYHTFACLPQTLLMLVLVIVSVEACLMFPIAIAFTPAVMIYILTSFVEKIFKKELSEDA